MSLIDLSNKVVLITGGSRGIGAATAALLARAGARVAITYRARAEDAHAVVAAIGAERAMAIQADMADRDANASTVSAAVARFGGLDCYIANAGVWPVDDVAVSDLTDARWRDTLAINLDGVFYGCRAAIRAMRDRDDGRIVIVTSTAGQRGEAFHADYAASKGALISFVKSLAIEVAPAITVNSVAPGWVDTEMSDRPYKAAGGRGRAEIERSIPLRRIATAEDIAGPIAFLCSSLGRHITGETINVNGGAVLCG
ncbi:MAG TPA: SDR family NAD(P)-dependent oxidoreductase [Gemmatimonadales bacterium]